MKVASVKSRGGKRNKKLVPVDGRTFERSLSCPAPSPLRRLSQKALSVHSAHVELVESIRISALALAYQDAQRYPQLVSVWNQYYDDPRFSYEQAGAIVHELIDSAFAVL